MHAVLVIAWLSVAASASATLISNVNLVFETFDAVSMVRFFEFNDKGWNISAPCIQDMFYYLDGLHRDVTWAMRLFDASGYYAGGLLDGNHIRSGNPDLCRQLNAEHQLMIEERQSARQQPINHPPPPAADDPHSSISAIRPQTRPGASSTRHTATPTEADRGGVYTAAMPSAPINESASAAQPFAVRLVIARYTLHVDRMLRNVGDGRLQVVQTVCMPRSCGADDLQQVMSYAQLPHMRSAAHVQDAELSALRLIGTEYVWWQDATFWVLSAILLSICSLMLVAEIYERCSRRSPKPQKPDPAPIPERFAFCTKSSFIAHIEIDKISKRSNGLDSASTLSRNLNGSDQLLDSLIINNFAPSTVGGKQDNIEQAKSLELQRNQKQHYASMDLWKDTCSPQPADGSLVYESAGSRQESMPTKEVNTDEEGLLGQLIGTFSWRRNLQRLLDIRVGSMKGENKGDCSAPELSSIEDDVQVVSGLKVICCLSIVLVHVCVFLVHISSNKQFAVHNTLMAQLLANGSVTIDVYFFLCGISMAHIFYTTASVIEAHQICGAVDQMLLFASMILFKLIRLTFPYLVVLIGLQLTMKHFHGAGILEIPSVDHQTCQEHMWKNILYIDTFFPVTQRCMPWSWYISLEAQLCLGATIILLLAQSHPRYAGTICAAFFASSIVASTILRYNLRGTQPHQQQQYQPHWLQSAGAASVESELLAMNGVYDQPWTRVSPYLLGLCLGYILNRTKRELKMNIIVVVLGWLACSALLLGIALRHLFLGGLNRWLRATVAATQHTIWPMCLLWVLLATMAGCGGPLGRALLSPRWRPLGKLSSCVLLVHPLVTRMLLLAAEHSVHLSSTLLVVIYAGLLVLIYAAAFGLHMLCEAPFAAVFHILYTRNFK